MKQVTIKDDPDMLDEYDFTGGVRGKYVERFAAGSNIVVLSPDVANFFPDSESVNPMKTVNQVFLCAQQAKVDGYRRLVDITLQDGEVYRCSLADSSERLRLAHRSLVEEWEWIGPQAGIHWPAVDEDLSIEYLVDKGYLLGNQEMVSIKGALLVPVS